MDAMTESVFDAPTFCKLAEMYQSPFQDEARTLFNIELAALKKSHNLLCDQCGNPGYAKARHDECAGLRFDLKEAFAFLGGGELNIDDVQRTIARVAVRSAEIEQDVQAANDAAPAAAPHVISPPSFMADFSIPAQTLHVQPDDRPEPEDTVELAEDVEDDESIWSELREICEDEFPEVFRFFCGAALFIVFPIALGYFLDVRYDPRTREHFIAWLHSAYDFACDLIEGVVGVAIGLALLWALRKALPYLGWIGLLLKVALAVDCFFVCFVIGFHETPWSFMHGEPFPSLAKPIWPLVVASVLAAGALVLPEVSEWFQARPSRLRKVFFSAAALVIISIFVVRDRPAPASERTAAPSPTPVDTYEVISKVSA